MFRTSRTEKARGAVAAGTDRVAEGASVAAERAGAAAGTAGEKATELKDKATAAAGATADQYAHARERAAEAAGAAKVRAEEAAEYVAPKVEHAKESLGDAKEVFVEEVLPKLLAAAATVAAGAVAAKEQAVETAERAPEALAVLKGEAEVKRGGKGKWVLLIGLAAAGAAVLAWRRSQERPDPWATATPYSPSTTGSSGSAVSDLREKAAGKAGEVKAAAAGAAAAATEKAHELKEAATEKAHDLKEAATAKAGAAADTVESSPADDLDDDTDAAADGAATWEDAGEFGDDDAPSISGTSEGSDLSTPNLDAGSTDGKS